MDSEFIVVKWGRVVQSGVKITQGSAKFEFRYNSIKSKFSLILLVCNLVIGCSKKNMENYPRKCFYTPKKRNLD